MPYGQYTDDLDGMIKRRNIRALVMINPIGFFYDQGHPMGAIYEAMQEFQTYINKKFKTGALKIRLCTRISRDTHFRRLSEER